MRTVVVRYETKPDRADENQRLVEKVYAELAERRPDNFRYVTLRLEDGVSFVHIVVENEGGSNPSPPVRPSSGRTASSPTDRGQTLPNRQRVWLYSPLPNAYAVTGATSNTQASPGPWWNAASRTSKRHSSPYFETYSSAMR